METRNKGPMKTLSRRSFVKASALTAAAAGVLGTTGLTGCSAITDAADGDAAQETIAYTYHPMNCGNRCSLKCTVRDGRLAHIQGNKWSGPEEKFSICCFKGMSEIQHVYSPKRIQQPLKRVGERGSGEFEAISWDEALDTVANAIKKAQGEHGPESVLFSYSSSISYSVPLLRKLLRCQVTHENGYDMGLGNGIDPTFGDGKVGEAVTEVYNWTKAKTIVLVGCNLLETGLTQAQFLLDAKEAGAKVIVVDPMHTATAAKADQWIPIKPGGDLAMYLGLISTIIEKKWYNASFMKAYTSAPFLVDADGKLVRDHEPKMVKGEDGTEALEDGAADPFMVWDEKTNSMQPYTKSGVKPALEGTFKQGGKNLTTVFSKLVESQKEYSAEWAAELTGISADTLVELARTIAKEGPVFIGLGFGGNDKLPNADLAGHAAAILASITGNEGVEGSGCGIVFSVVSPNGALGSWALPEEFANAALEMQTPLKRTTKNPTRVLLNWGNSITQGLGNWNVTKEWLKTLDFVLTVDPYHCDSADWSDIILPATTCFETRNDVENIITHKKHVLIQEKVIDPLFESKTDFEIEQELCKRLGLDKYLPKSREEYNAALMTTEDPKMAGITLDKLKENNGLMRIDISNDPVDPHAGQVYPTTSGRIELYHEGMVKHGMALPVYEECAETGPSSKLRSKYPLQFWQMRRKYRVHSTFQDCTWIKQIVGVGLVRINPDEAASRGLKDGDKVKVANDRGEITATVAVDNTVPAGAAVMNDGSWASDTGGESFQVLVNDTLNDRAAELMYGAPIPFNDTLVEVTKA